MARLKKQYGAVWFSVSLVLLSLVASPLSSPLSGLSSVSDSDMPRAVSRPCPGFVLRQRGNGESPGNLLNFC